VTCVADEVCKRVFRLADMVLKPGWRSTISARRLQPDVWAELFNPHCGGILPGRGGVAELQWFWCDAAGSEFLL
jgi:hypothetical protein